CVPDAIELARTFGSAITLLTVLQPRFDVGAQPCSDALDSEIARLEASAYLGRVQHEIVAGASDIRVDARIEQGHTAERIVASARDRPAGLRRGPRARTRTCGTARSWSESLPRAPAEPARARRHRCACDRRPAGGCARVTARAGRARDRRARGAVRAWRHVQP